MAKTTITSNAAQNKLTMARAGLLNAVAQFIANDVTIRRAALQKYLNQKVDINYECNYPDTISASDYQEMYDRNGVAERVVKIMPVECWKTPPEIYETEEPDETEFEKAWKALNDQRQALQYMQRIDVLSGIGRFGVLLVGLNDGKNLSEPVEGIDPSTGETSGNAKREVMYFKPLAESDVTVDSKEFDNTNPRYGLPKHYNITFEQATTSGSTQTSSRVHWTRVVHIADNRQTSEIYGKPRMKAVYNRLLNIRKIMGGSGEMFWKGGFPGYTAEVDPQIAPSLIQDGTLNATLKKELKEEIELWQNSMQRMLAITGMKFKSLQPQVSDPNPHFEANCKFIAITLGIPYRVFMGTEEARLASGQDVRAFNSRVANRQNHYLTPMLIRPLIDRLIAYGALPETKDGYKIAWPDLNTPTEKDRAEVSKTKTEAIARYVTGDGASIFGVMEFLTMILGLSADEAEQALKSAGQYDQELIE